MHVSPILLLFCQLIQRARVCLHRQRDSRSCCLKHIQFFFKSPESGTALRTSLKCTGFDLLKCISTCFTGREMCGKLVNQLRGRLHDKVFGKKQETFYAFFLFIYMTTAFWGLKTNDFENATVIASE